MSDLDKAVDEACEPLTPRQELCACADMASDAIDGLKKVLMNTAHAGALLDFARIESRKPCEHPNSELVYHANGPIWCSLCGAIGSHDHQWRLPERGR